MNTNTFLNNNYKSNERALADLLGQLVRGRNPSPPGFNRGGVGSSGGGYGGPSMGQSSRGSGGGGGGGWGGNAPNDWNQGSVGGGFGSGSGSGFGSGGGGASVGGSGNIMPLMQRGTVGMNMNGGGGGFGGMSRDDVYGGGSGMNDNFDGNYMGMSRGNQSDFGGMQSSRGMSSGGFGGGGFTQSENFGGDNYDDAPPPPRSRGMWVSGSTNRSSRNIEPTSSRTRSRPSIETAPRRRRRRSLSGSKAPLSSRHNRSGGASASGNTSRSGQASKRRAADIPAPPTKTIKSSSSSSHGTKPAASVRSAKAIEPRKVLTSLGGRWYQHFLKEGLTPEEARNKAFENNNKEFTAIPEGSTKKSSRKPRPSIAETYVRAAIFAKGFPENMLDPEDLSSLEELIIDEIANNTTANKIQFERLIKKPGMLIIDCTNQHTADWLKEIIPKLSNWESPELEICNEENIPDAHIMTISLPRSSSQEFDQTLAIIQAQNSDLVTDSWEWVHERRHPEHDRLIITMRIDKESYDTLKERRWKIFYKFGLIEVNFARYLRYGLSKRRRREEAAKNDEKNDEQPNEAEEENNDVKEESPPSPPPAPIISIDD